MQPAGDLHRVILGKYGCLYWCEYLQNIDERFSAAFGRSKVVLAKTALYPECDERACAFKLLMHRLCPSCCYEFSRIHVVGKRERAYLQPGCARFGRYRIVYELQSPLSGSLTCFIAIEEIDYPLTGMARKKADMLAR